MTFTHQTGTGFVLVLLDGTEKDILGVWGPYRSEPDAQWALKELNLWPIDGIWDLHPLKYFPSPRTVDTHTPQVRTAWSTQNGIWS